MTGDTSHKLENFINDVAQLPDLIFGELFQTNGTIANRAKGKFSFEIKNWTQFYVVHKINWIVTVLNIETVCRPKYQNQVDLNIKMRNKELELLPKSSNRIVNYSLNSIQYI